MIIFSLRNIIHLSLHYLAPFLIGKTFYGPQWKKATLILLLTNLVDLDHFLSDPIYNPERLSIGNHLFHSYPFIFLYFLLLIPRKSRTLAVGLIFHMLTDLLDHFWPL